MSLDFAFTTTRPPLRGRGRPATPLPVGLSDDVIRKIRRRSEKMARSNNANFAVIFTAKIFAALAEHGLARLSPREVLSLAKMADDMPPDLSTVVAAFLASHPPHNANYAIMVEAIRRGRIGGPNALIQLHFHIRDRARKAHAAKLKRMALTAIPNPSRPKLLPPDERAKAKAQQAEAETEREIAAANEALARLYPIRHQSRLKSWLDFLECCQSLRDAGYGLVERNRKQILQIAREMSVT